MTGTDLFTAMIGLVSRNKRRYGGYIVHVGIVLIFLGFAGEGFSRDEQMLLKPGEQATVGDYTLRLDAMRVTDDGQKQMVTGHITVMDTNGAVIEQMRPAKWFFRKHEDEPTTEVAIRRSFAEDLYIVMPAFEMEEQTASVEVHINPLVNWIWFGFGILAHRHRHRAAAGDRPALRRREAAGRSRTASLLCCQPAAADRRWPSRSTSRQDRTRDSSSMLVARGAGKLAHKLACWCGGCSKLPVGQCACAHCAIERAKIDGMLKEGKNESEIVEFYVDTFGGNQILSDRRIADPAALCG